MIFGRKSILPILVAAIGLAMPGAPVLAQAALAQRKPIVIPPRPYPPLGAPPSVIVPPRGADGVRHTINSGLDEVQTLANLRSAYNVAALNCLRPEHAEIVIGYRAFLKTHAAAIAANTRTMDAGFRNSHGAGFMRAREAYMTQVYNYFANPTTLSGFCDAALIMSRAAQAVPAGQLVPFARAELPRLEAVFESFYSAYEQYRVDAAQWDAQYAALVSQIRGGATSRR